MADEIATVSTGEAMAMARRLAHGLVAFDGELIEQREEIARKQSNIEKLSGDVLGLQDILSNKQTRGAFGEIQLREIVRRALPPDAATFQATLSNGRRADCLIHLPNPPGPIVIDSKFPLEAYQRMTDLSLSETERKSAERQFKIDIRKHIQDIAEKYIIHGETADGAVMFIPAEAVFAEISRFRPSNGATGGTQRR